MTPKQLNGMYWEAIRQQARQRLHNIEDSLASKDFEYRKKHLEELDARANPVDPEADGDFGKDDIRMVRRLMGGAARNES